MAKTMNLLLFETFLEMSTSISFTGGLSHDIEIMELVLMMLSHT